MLINENCIKCQIRKNLNIYYLFLCKCEAFMKRFDVPQFTGIMTKETLYREI